MEVGSTPVSCSYHLSCISQPEQRENQLGWLFPCCWATFFPPLWPCCLLTKSQGVTLLLPDSYQTPQQDQSHHC